MRTCLSLLLPCTSLTHSASNSSTVAVAAAVVLICCVLLRVCVCVCVAMFVLPFLRTRFAASVDAIEVQM